MQRGQQSQPAGRWRHELGASATFDCSLAGRVFQGRRAIPAPIRRACARRRSAVKGATSPAKGPRARALTRGAFPSRPRACSMSGDWRAQLERLILATEKNLASLRHAVVAQTEDRSPLPHTAFHSPKKVRAGRGQRAAGCKRSQAPPGVAPPATALKTAAGTAPPVTPARSNPNHLASRAPSATRCSARA